MTAATAHPNCPSKYKHDMAVVYDVDEETGARTVADWVCTGCKASAGYPEAAVRMARELCPERTPEWYWAEHFRIGAPGWGRIWAELAALGIMMALGTYFLSLLWRVVT